jgi:hypothetical protein
MQLHMHPLVETNQSHKSNSEGDILQWLLDAEGAAFENDLDSVGVYSNIDLGFLI